MATTAKGGSCQATRARKAVQGLESRNFCQSKGEALRGSSLKQLSSYNCEPTRNPQLFYMRRVTVKCTNDSLGMPAPSLGPLHHCFHIPWALTDKQHVARSVGPHDSLMWLQFHSADLTRHPALYDITCMSQAKSNSELVFTHSRPVD